MGDAVLRDLLMQSSLAQGEKTAIRFLREGKAETEISYKKLDRDSNRMANYFLDLGVARGDRIIFYIQKSLAFVIAHLALQKIGAIGIPVSTGLKQSEMRYLLEDTEANVVLSGPEQETIVKEIDPRITTVVIHTERPYQELDFFRSSPDTVPQVEIKAEDPSLIVYTSGTTGKPKGAILTQRNLVHDARNLIDIWEITESDVVCHALPLFHVHGLCFELHTALIAGAHVIMFDRFSAEEVIAVLAKRDGADACTVFMAVPAIYTRLMDYMGGKKLDFHHMRLMTSGSAPLLAKDFHRIKDIFGKEPVEREGMSETGINFSNPLHGIKKPGSIGLPLPDLEVKIVDPESGSEVVPGQPGEVWLKSPSITPGYWRKPEETKKAFDNGWFKTGDLARVDEDGYYYLTDRIKHIIISGGENISPKEVENVINQIDGVAESSVVGVPDEQWGEKVVAAIVVKPGSNIAPHEIQAFCRSHLHDWKVPKKIHFMKELPKNKLGEVLKEEVKKAVMQ